MLTFTLKTLLVTVTTATFGFAMIFYTLGLKPIDRSIGFLEFFSFFALWFTSGAIISGAFASLLKQAFVGAIVGIIVQFMTLFAL